MKKILCIIVSVINFLAVTEVKAQYGIVVYGQDKDTLCFIPDNLVGIHHGEPDSSCITLVCPDTTFVRSSQSIDSIGFVPIPERVVLSDNIGEWSEMRMCKDGTAVLTQLENDDKPIEMVMMCPNDSLGMVFSDIHFDGEARPVEVLMNNQELLFDWIDNETFNLTVILSDSISCKYDSLRYNADKAEYAKPKRFVPDINKKPWLTRLGGVLELAGGTVSTVVGAVMVAGSGVTEIFSAGSSTPISLPGIGLGLMAVSSGTESMANGFMNAFTNDYATGWDNVGRTLLIQTTEEGIKRVVLPNVPDKYFSYLVDSKYNPTKTGLAAFLATLLGQILSNIQQPYTLSDLKRDVQKGVVTGLAKDITHNKATLLGYIWPYILESPSERFRTEYGIRVDDKEKFFVKKEQNGDGGVIEYTFDGLKPNTEYTYYTYYWDKTNSVSAFGEVRSFKTNAIIPKITSFKQTDSKYEKGGFSHNGNTYDYKYDVAVTVEIESTEGVADWGYVYKDPYGQTALISLKSFGKSYTDTRYVYYRNESPSTVTLYGYVKYEGDDEYVYGDPKAYPVQHGQTHCPDSNHPHMIDLGLPSGTLWSCCNEGASKPEDFGGYYRFGVVSSAPSLDQIKELLNNCSYKWTTLNGVRGGQFTSGKNGGSIFLPAAGHVRDGELDHVGSYGDYWSSTPDGEACADLLFFSSGYKRWNNWYGWYGIDNFELPVRPVR